MLGIQELLIDEALEYVYGRYYGIPVDTLKLQKALLYSFIVESVLLGCNISSAGDKNLHKQLEVYLYQTQENNGISTAQ